MKFSLAYIMRGRGRGKKAGTYSRPGTWLGHPISPPRTACSPSSSSPWAYRCSVWPPRRRSTASRCTRRSWSAAGGALLGERQPGPLDLGSCHPCRCVVRGFGLWCGREQELRRAEGCWLSLPCWAGCLDYIDDGSLGLRLRFVCYVSFEELISPPRWEIKH